MEYNYYQRGYNHRYSRDMDNLNPGLVYHTDRRSRWDQNYRTEVRTMSHQHQNPCQSYQNQDYMNNMPCQMSVPLHVSDKVQYAKQSHENWTRMGQQDIVRLSKTLAFLLRHGAEKLGFHFMPGGFLYVDQLLEKHKPLKGFTREQIKELVRTNDKQRFYLQKDDEGRLMIRANQGHTTVVEGLDLSPIYDASEVQMVVHGTYYQAWDQIQNTGLSRMKRNHIHFAAGMPGESGVISGMRKSCEVVIEIDLVKALKAGIPFFRSANNVILSPGNEKGFIPPSFFKSVFDRHSGEELMPLDFLSVQVAAERSSQRCILKRVREGQREDEYPCKKRRDDRSSSMTAGYKKEGSTKQSGTLKSKKDDGKFRNMQNEKDKEETKQMRSKDEKGGREKSRSDRDEKEERTSEPQNENERNMARPMRSQDVKEEISKSHSAKRKERTEQVRREDEKEVGETSMNRSGEGKGEGKKLKFHTGEEQMKETRRQLKTEDNKGEVELRYGQWPKI